VPYKNKKDRTAAVRRYREKKSANELYIAKADKFDSSLADLLKLAGFQEVPYAVFVECSQGLQEDSNGVWHTKEGRVVYPPKQMFFGRNTIIAGSHFDEQVNAYIAALQDLWEFCEAADQKRGRDKPE